MRTRPLAHSRRPAVLDVICIHCWALVLAQNTTLQGTVDAARSAPSLLLLCFQSSLSPGQSHQNILPHLTHLYLQFAAHHLAMTAQNPTIYQPPRRLRVLSHLPILLEHRVSAVLRQPFALRKLSRLWRISPCSVSAPHARHVISLGPIIPAVRDVERCGVRENAVWLLTGGRGTFVHQKMLGR